MIVIPMAGLSSRFKRAGFELPKYMLEARGSTLFEHAILSFKRFFENERFLFICLGVNDTVKFIKTKSESLGIKNYEIVCLEHPTAGQAETVVQGLKASSVNKEERLLIFNIDTFRPNYEFPSDFDIDEIDGYLETFIGSGPNWSNVVPVRVGSSNVLLTAEKKELSEFCCTGIYMWKNYHLFLDAFTQMKNQPIEELDGNEYYIAPMYNHVIENGGDVRFSIVDRSEVIFCGVPDEYWDFANAD
ncbi:capsular biosynthesis protein [Neiella marina]|uniref:Capsular biosynthesis protein n=1 Tax=Neiella holothuriorum TaxID=2870530 RepID=A0ABS7EEI3_9GAMM|nr:capsular biosynthesis protein [Neiella holothuriorum]MBW8190749.1 capsular biosynthesis protein [Neiella holothuriorum]